MDAHNIRISKMKLNVKRVGRRALKLTAWHRHSVLGHTVHYTVILCVCENSEYLPSQ